MRISHEKHGLPSCSSRVTQLSHLEAQTRRGRLEHGWSPRALPVRFGLDNLYLHRRLASPATIPPMNPEARDKLKATLLGMVGSAMQKYPSASKGDLKDVWNAAVDERYAARKAKEAEEAKKRAAKRRAAAARKRDEAQQAP